MYFRAGSNTARSTAKAPISIASPECASRESGRSQISWLENGYSPMEKSTRAPSRTTNPMDKVIVFILKANGSSKTGTPSKEYINKRCSPAKKTPRTCPRPPLNCRGSPKDSFTNLHSRSICCKMFEKL